MQKQTTDNFIMGHHPVADAIRAAVSMDKVLLQEGIRGEMEKEIRHLCKDAKIPLVIIPKERFAKYTRGNHQGVIALVASVRYYELGDVLPSIFEKGENPLIVITDGVTDVRNIGAIARSAECCGAHTLVVGQKGAAPINEEAVKASAGALMKIPVCREKSLVTAIELLANSGVRTFAADIKGSKPVYELDFTGPVAIVMGSEGEGVSEGVLSRVHERFFIPQVGTTDSFNVSVAAGIVLYEIMKQRKLEK
jgi:23S rRNA (guanosine2251-2'-O)-methyltransferase